MKHWTRRRWASLAIHLAFVSVPFTLSTVSAAGDEGEGLVIPS